MQTCSTVSASTSQRVIITRVMARRPTPIYSSLDLGDLLQGPHQVFFFLSHQPPHSLTCLQPQHTLSLFQQHMANSYSSRKAPSYRLPFHLQVLPRGGKLLENR